MISTGQGPAEDFSPSYIICKSTICFANLKIFRDLGGEKMDNKSIAPASHCLGNTGCRSDILGYPLCGKQNKSHRSPLHLVTQWLCSARSKRFSVQLMFC